MSEATHQSQQAHFSEKESSEADFEGASLSPPSFQLKASTHQSNSGPFQRAVIQRADNGNTDLLQRIRSASGSRAADADARPLITDLQGLSTDRQRVVIFELIRSGHIGNFKNNILGVVQADFASMVTLVASLEAEFADPTTGTAASTSAQDTQIEGILNQGLNVTSTGAVAAFIDDVAGRTYSQDVTDTLSRELARGLPRARTRNGLPRHAWGGYESIAQEAKTRTDQLFGHLNTGPALTHTGTPQNLFDTRDQSYSNGALYGFANYLVTGHSPWDPVYPGQTIHQVHNADLNRSTEAGILRTAITTWMGQGSNLAELTELRRSWPGSAGGGNVFLQRWDHGNQAENRRQFWSTFQTMIHEYIHTITHADFYSATARLGRTKEQVYTEGGCSWYDNKVWETINPTEIANNDQLRANVEGGSYAYDPSVIPQNTGYRQITQFDQIVNTIGENNMNVAFFQGQVDRIGLTP